MKKILNALCSTPRERAGSPWRSWWISGLLESVIDITTTEVADHLFGGILPCTEDRFGSIIRTKIPYVGSVGAVDMVNFGARDTVPKTFEGRKFYIHNPQVTLMRTTPAENRAIGDLDCRAAQPHDGAGAVSAAAEGCVGH